jgi:putative ABC transport system permease protein
MATAVPPNPVSPSPASSRPVRTRPLGASSHPSTFDQTLASATSTIRFAETVNLAIDSFRASKARFLLTMLGMVIGSASIVLVVTIGLTGKQYALDTISSIGPNKVEMMYSGGNVIGPDNISTPDLMTRDDMQAVDSQVPGIVASSPMIEVHERIGMGSGITKEAMLLGVSPEYKKIRNLRIEAGRFFDEQDSSGHTKAAVILGPFATALFGSPQAAINQTISVKGIPFTVIGVFVERVELAQGIDEIGDQTILIPYEVGRYFQGTDSVKEIFFEMREPSMVAPAAREITDIIQSRHRPGSVYKASTLVGILSTMDKIADGLSIVLLLASFVTLVVSGVGIMNSMLANVQSRLREIGIRKALGATRKEIRLQFLTEAVFLSLSGGIIGTVLGLAIPLSVNFFTEYKIPITWWSAVIALLTSVIVGVVFGTVPATRAANLDPVETLKYE